MVKKLPHIIFNKRLILAFKKSDKKIITVGTDIITAYINNTKGVIIERLKQETREAFEKINKQMQP